MSFQIGICVPDTCNSAELHHDYTRKIFKTFLNSKPISLVSAFHRHRLFVTSTNNLLCFLTMFYQINKHSLVHPNYLKTVDSYMLEFVLECYYDYARFYNISLHSIVTGNLHYQLTVVWTIHINIAIVPLAHSTS